MRAITTRQERGRAIAQVEGAVRRINKFTYEVRSQSGNGWYPLVAMKESWLCSCPDFIYRGVKCKHIWAVEISTALREQVESQVIIQPINAQMCPSCQSDKIVKHGIRHNKYGDIQQFLCNDCGRTFVVNLGFENMKVTPQAITSAMQLYFTGESFRNVQKFLRLQGVKVSHVAVYKWIRKYVELMEKYLEQIKPQVSDTWRADELYVKIKGDMRYVFALMDDETRFWIAQEVADSKFNYDARRLFQKGKEATGTRPMTLITDGLPAYNDAYKKEFWTSRVPRTEHVQHIRLSGDMNNNRMERFNGEVRDREKVLRGLKRPDSPLIKGYQIYHNYMRPHEGLKGKTPAEACGIKIEGKDKWMTIIQNATKKGA